MEDTAVYIEQIDQLNSEAWRILKEERERARALSQQAGDLSATGVLAQTPYRRGIAESLRTLSRIYTYDGKYEQSLSMALESLAILEEENLPELMAEVIYTIATNYLTLGNLASSLDYFLKQLEICEAVDDREGYARALLGLGSLYSDMEDVASSLAYYEQSLAVFKEIGDHYWIALLMNNICYALYEQADLDKALEWGLRGLEYCRTHHIVRVEGIITSSIAEVYLALEQPELALENLERSIELSHQDVNLMTDNFALMGRVHFHRQEYEQALTAVNEALKLAETSNFKRRLLDCHKLLADIYKAIGNYKEALHHFEQFHAVQEVVYTEEIGEKLKNFEILQRTQAAQKEAALYASLYQEEQARRAFAETMQRVGVAITSSIELKEVLDTILAQLDHLVPYDRGSVLMRRGKELEFVAMRGFPEESKVQVRNVPLDNNPDSTDVFIQIYHSRRPLALVDLAGYGGWQQVSNLPLPGAWLGVPLIHRGEVRGMLSLVREEKRPYVEEEIAVATTFAATAVVALENAKLYNRARRFSEQLEYEVRQRTQALQEAYAQLERLDRTKGDFITVTAHELRTPITVIKAYSQLLQDRDPEAPVDDSLINGIVNGINRMHDIVNTMLWMVKIDSHALEVFPEPLNIIQLISRILRELDQDIKGRRQRVIIDDTMTNLPSIAGDASALKMVFVNVLINAIKYTPDGGEIRIYGRHWETPPQHDLPADSVAVTIADSGIGIAPESLELIFGKFYQTGNVALHSTGKSKFKGGGPGLGLAIARGIIEAHHGRLWAESEGHDESRYPGSQFHIVLPRAQPRHI